MSRSFVEPPPPRRAFPWIPASIGLFLGVLAACGSLSQDFEPCGEIPEGGCPLGRGGSCTDLLCAALYDCRDGAWTLSKQCPPVPPGDAGDDAGGADAACDPITLDHSGEAAGCTPDLQSPDCPAAAAETCAATACFGDCSDFFLCTADGWATVAYCTEDGELVVTQ